MKIPEQIKIDLALRRAERLEFDPYTIKVAGIYLAIFFSLAIIILFVYAILSYVVPHTCMPVM